MRISSTCWTLVLLVVLVISPAHAQSWESDGSDLFYNDGNVAIGTDNPAHLLDIGESSIRARITRSKWGDPYELGLAEDLGRRVSIASEQGSIWQAMVFADAHSHGTDTMFGVAASFDAGETWHPNLAILQNGRIGMGTTSPERTLQVGGYSEDRALIIGGQNYSRTASEVLFADGSVETGVGLRYDSDANKLHVDDNYNNNGSATSRVELLTVDRDAGNVGIGTTDPDEQLEINGTTRTKEVIVETENWPDYVFDDGYELRSLAELAAFIDREGHLPALPSAETIEGEGQTVGGVQRGLVQMVEELVLYAVEQEERAARHEVRADSLAKHMGVLRKKVQTERRAREQQQQQIDTVKRQNRQIKKQLEMLRRRLENGEG